MENLPKTIKNYLIDIDGTICDDIPNEYPEKMVTAQELPGSNAKEILNGLYDAGHIVTFFTSRTEQAHGDITRTWLREHGFKHHGVLFGKPRGGNYHWVDNLEVRATQFKGKFTPFVTKNKDILVFDDESR